MSTTQARTECADCLNYTLTEVEEDYIANHKLSGVNELVAEDHAAIAARATQLLEEDRGVACTKHYFEA